VRGDDPEACISRRWRGGVRDKVERISVIPVKTQYDKRAYMLASVLLFTMSICIFITSRDNIALCLHGFFETKDSKSSVIGKLKKGTVSRTCH